MNHSDIELIQIAVDGETSAAQKLELASLLESSGEARSYFESMQRVRQAIETAPLAEPVPSVRQDVMEALRKRGGSVVSIDDRRTQRRRQFVYLWAAAAVVLVLVALYPMVSAHRTAVSASQAGATMTAVNSGSWPVVARLSERDDAVTATLVVRRHGDELAIDARVTPGSANLSLRWDPLQMTPLDLPGAKSDDAVFETKGSVAISQNGRTARPVLLRIRSGATGPSDVAIVSNGRVLVKATITAD